MSVVVTTLQEQLLAPNLRREVPASLDCLVTATRFWAKSERDIKHLNAFLHRASEYSTVILVAVNVDADTQDTLHQFSKSDVSANVVAIPVSPWGGATHALNLVIHHSLSKYPHAKLILFQSVEVLASRDDILQLAGLFCSEKNNVLVAGRALPGHTMYGIEGFLPRMESVVDATPWNTLALWDLKKLGDTGFPAIADRMVPPGMEEVGAIVVQQRLYGDNLRRAFLVCDKGVQWDTEFGGERAKAHELKMKSKRDRARLIMEGIRVARDENKGVGFI